MSRAMNDIAKRVIQVAWEQYTRGSHLKFTRPGVQAVFFSGTPGDHRAYQNGVAKLRRADRGAA